MSKRSRSAGAAETAIIIGAGPAGLTAAYELVTRSDIKPIVLERDPTYVGGISKTVRHNGNRIDIGGHRFFSKSDRVMEWWANIMPVEAVEEGVEIAYQGKRAPLKAARSRSAPSSAEDVLLVRTRKSRILYEGNLYEYPITLSIATLRKLGAARVLRIGWTYLYSVAFPRKPVRSLEDFMINRFGSELYRTFFKSYTEKVWGVPCNILSAEWGEQRIKGVSVAKAVQHAIRNMFPKRRADVSQKTTETSLIGKFLYPRYGPGHLWERVADEVEARGGKILLGHTVRKFVAAGNRISEVVAVRADGTEERYSADLVFSTMPVRELVRGLGEAAPDHIHMIADGLQYRDFITVGLLADKLTPEHAGMDDTWLYVHDPDVSVCRLQFFKNWSPSMVADPAREWIGLEYICSEDDDLWRESDAGLIERARRELVRLGFVRAEDIRDGVVLRQHKAYPSYTGTYERFSDVRTYLDTIGNLFLLGRNGMHRYNNQDHSMLTAMTAVDLILAGDAKDKNSIWSVNTEQEYHEERTA